MSILKTENLKKYYGKEPNVVRALDGVSLEIEDGEFVAVVGTSGSGKSTLLNMIGGLDVPSEGKVIIAGKDLSGMDDDRLTIFRRRRIGFVFQNYNLIPILNVYENIVLPVSLDGEKPDVTYLKKITSLLGLEERLTEMPNNLSGGQQQRVAIARALAKNPKLLLCDEPTGALDYVTGKAILKLLQDTCRKKGMTVIVITHNSALTPMADRIVRIRNGKVAEMVQNENPTPVEEIEW